MSAPKWAGALLRRLAPPREAEDVLGDLEEAHRDRVERHGRGIASVLSGLEALDMAVALLRGRIGGGRAAGRASGAAFASAGRSAGSEVGSLRGGRKRLRVSWLDVKLGFRMLVKYPGVALIGGLGIALAIAIGAVSFDITAALVHSTLPFEEGERVVAIESWDVEANDQERRILHDFVTWRDELESVEELGAWRPLERNLITADGRAEPVPLAEMTASGFRLARVPPLLGRTLVEADEREGAPPVIVIGYDMWRTRFASDPEIVGRPVRLGATRHTVVGVMPEGFEFPVFHGIWVPLRADPSAYERRRGPGIRVFGRLAPGATLEEARAELTTIGRRAAAAYPATHERLRPRIMPYTMQLLDDMEGWEFHVVRFLVTMLLVVICVNVAILVYARTATRRGEIAVRSALGASRGRVVGQLFVEALVLSSSAAALGIVIAAVSLRQVDALVERLLFVPFWMDIGLSTGTVAYVAGLAVLGAVIVGVVPALKATGRRVHTGLQRLGSGGSGMRMGGTWTALIVVQVAFAVAVLPTAVLYAGDLIGHGFVDPGFAAEDFLTARLEIDRETTSGAGAYERAFASRYGDRLTELVRRLEAEPGVSDATFAMSLPGGEPRVWVEVEGVPTPTDAVDPGAARSGTGGHAVGIGRVAIDFFDAFDVPILTGRRFRSEDLGAAATAVIVNRTFVRRVLGGRNALGRRVRYVGRGGDFSAEDVELGRWYEIVGVVPDFPKPIEGDRPRARLFHPLAPGRVYPVSLALRVRGAAAATFAGRLRETAAALDPALRLDEFLPLDEVLRQEQGAMRMGALAIAVVTLSVLLLSAAGIHALMSFTVTRRRREIAIRSALGADPRRLLASVFARALGQLAIGVVIGFPAAAVLLTIDDPMDGEKAGILLAVAALMLAVGLLAAVGPARRGLRIQPTDALREE